jgi:membrane protein implicated in regulation of membrane protease activity
MVRSHSSIGTILAIIGILVSSFVLLWTGNESVVIILAAGYFFLWGYYDIDLGWFGSTTDSGLHLFNLNWYLEHFSRI